MHEDTVLLWIELANIVIILQVAAAHQKPLERRLHLPPSAPRFMRLISRKLSDRLRPSCLAESNSCKMIQDSRSGLELIRRCRSQIWMSCRMRMQSRLRLSNGFLQHSRFQCHSELDAALVFKTNCIRFE